MTSTSAIRRYEDIKQFWFLLQASSGSWLILGLVQAVDSIGYIRLRPFQSVLKPPVLYNI